MAQPIPTTVQKASTEPVRLSEPAKPAPVRLSSQDRLETATAFASALIQGGRGSNMDTALDDAIRWADLLLEKLGK